MLARPTKGFARSTQEHNVCRAILCDWIECSILLNDGELSTTDVADVLMEEEIYETEDFARQMVTNAWAELHKRRSWIGESYAFKLDSMWIRRKEDWKSFAAHTFCLLLSLAPSYDWWTGEFGPDYTDQGDMFELLTLESLVFHFSGWTVYQTGWTRVNTAGLQQIVSDVANRLGEELVHPELWDQPTAKEMGLDLLCYRAFSDGRVGIPVYLIQCASGGNWRNKRHTPDLHVWNDMIGFRNQPQRAFSVPFSFSEPEFTRNCVVVKGLFLDRCRLLKGSNNWISRPLADRIIAWAEPRIETLLKRSE